MRMKYAIIFTFLIAALIVCTVQAWRSGKPIRKAVGLLEAALIPPVVGNLLIVASGTKSLALVGHYTYYLSMDLVMYALVNFTNEYCKGIGKGDGSHKPTVIYIALAADAVQIALNLVFGHTFTTRAETVVGSAYYRLVPLAGQTIHRIVDYSVFACVIMIFVLATVKTVKIYREKYTMILAAMSTIGLFQTYYIFSKSPIDRSMIGYGVFGLIIYYFAILYRPLRLLDRMLSNIVSDLSDSFYIFDPNGRCIWANDQGCKLVDENNGNYDGITAKLRSIFGNDNEKSRTRILKRSIGCGESARYFELEESHVKDNAGNLSGTYLRIRDVTSEERVMRKQEEQIGQISQEAYKDALTGVDNKAAYNKYVSSLCARISEGFVEFAVVMVDMNNLKQINDDYGHKAGDLYIKGCCHLICEVFKHSPVFRIGGDEFVAILTNTDYVNRVERVEELRNEYARAFANSEADAWERYSAAVGIAEHASDDNSYELVFKRADSAMYDEKKSL